RVYVLSGKDGSLLYAKGGEKAGNNMGWSVGGTGDVNQDGFADFLAGADNWGNPSGGSLQGRVYLYSGKDGSLIFTFQGENTFDFLGNSLSGAMDVNLDGYPDLAAGASSWSNPPVSFSFQGRVYVY